MARASRQQGCGSGEGSLASSQHGRKAEMEMAVAEEDKRVGWLHFITSHSREN